MIKTLKTPIPDDATYHQINNLECGYLKVAKEIGDLKLSFKNGRVYHETNIHGEPEKIKEMEETLLGMLETQRSIKVEEKK